jgi:hypothetical protein
MPPAGRAAEPQFKALLVQHCAAGNGTGFSQYFTTTFCSELGASLMKHKAAETVLQEGASIPSADAPNSLVLECKLNGDASKSLLYTAHVQAEISVYRASDHALAKTFTAKADYKGMDKEEHVAQLTADMVGNEIRKAIKDVNLASIPPAPPPPAAPSTAAPSAAPATVAETVWVKFASNPTGAEITIDGNYAGSTPAQIKMNPGKHSIQLTKAGHQDWVRSIEIVAGESRTFTPELQPAKP